MDNLDNDYLDSLITELISVLGVRQHVDQYQMVRLIQSNHIKDCIKTIAEHLGLPINVNLSYVPKGYRPDVQTFSSHHLVKTDKQGKSYGGITAQVQVPNNLPFYGSDSMKGVYIDVKISEESAKYPLTFISVIAHELSHIVLDSIRHEHKNNEFCVDLTAMILGFTNVMRTGRKTTDRTTDFWSSKTTITTTTYGYLSDKNFDYAVKRIEGALEESRKKNQSFLEKTSALKRELEGCKRSISTFEKYLLYLDKHPVGNISQEDAYRISLFHHPGHVDSLALAIRNCDAAILIPANPTDTSGSTEKINVMLEDLRSLHSILTSDISILKRYISPVQKMKLNLIG